MTPVPPYQFDFGMTGQKEKEEKEEKEEEEKEKGGRSRSRRDAVLLSSEKLRAVLRGTQNVLRHSESHQQVFTKC